MKSSIERVLVAVDLDQHAEKIIQKTVMIANNNKHCTVKAIHCLPIFNSSYYQMYNLGGYFPQDTIENIRKESLKEAQHRLNTMCVNHPVIVEQEIIEGPVVDAIIEEAKDYNADIVIVGSRSKTGILSFLGSTTNSLLNKSFGDMMVIKV